MLNPNHCVLGLEIFTKHSQGSLLEDLLRTFGGICDALDVTQVAEDDIQDLARRLV